MAEIGKIIVLGIIVIFISFLFIPLFVYLFLFKKINWDQTKKLYEIWFWR